MDIETSQYIKRILKKDDRVKYCFDVDYEKNGKKEHRIFAIIKNDNELHQYGIFLIITSIIFSYTIEQVYPFTKELLIEKIDALNFTLGWKGKNDKLKLQCKLATSLASFLQFHELQKTLHMPSSDYSFQKKLSHNWLWRYKEFIDPEILTQQDVISNSSEIQLDIHFKERIGGLTQCQTGSSSQKIDNETRIENTYITEQLSLRKAEYSTEENLCIYVMTYNAGGKKPKADLPELFFSGKATISENEGVLADLYIFCIQEVCPLNTKNVIAKSDNAQIWEAFLLKSLNQFATKKRQEFTVLVSRDMFGLFTVVFIREDKESMCNKANLSTAEVAVGVFGIVRNKGAIGISLSLGESKLCIVNSHFTSDQDKLKQRIQDYKTICANMRFEAGEASHDMFEHDALLWAGDLNFRTNVKSLEEAVKLLEENHFDMLLKQDQLCIEKDKGSIFKDFNEGPIKFWPTYKYREGSNAFDMEKKRQPGWCDRILYKGDMLAQVFYLSLDTFDWSDHKPVVALFKNKIYKSDIPKKDELINKLKETFSTLLKESVPKAQVDKTELVVTNIKYGVETSGEFNILNVGEIPIEYRIPKKDINWFSLRPTLGLILPGQKTKVAVSILVTNEEVRKLHSDPDYLKASIPVMISGKQELTVNISGAFLKSCFGASVELLNSVHEPFASIDPRLTSDELIRKCRNKLTIPKEIYMLTRWLAQNGLKTEKLFALVGSEESKAQIRDSLEHYTELPSNLDPYSVADILVELLESMPDIIPEAIIVGVVEEYERSGDTDERMCDLFLTKLPEYSSTLVVYLLSFCKYLLEYSDYNNLSVEILVKVLSACLVQSDTEKLDIQYVQEQDSERRAKIAQIAVKLKLRFQGLFALLLIS